MWWKLPLGVLSLAVVLFGIWRSVLTVQHAHDRVYDLSTGTVVIVLVATGVALVSAIPLVLFGRPRIVFAVFLATLVVGMTFLIFPFLGILMLAALLVFAGMRGLGRRSGRTVLPSVSAAAALALTLPILLVAGNQRPIVRCHQGGADMSGGSFTSDVYERTIASSSTRGGITRGTVSFGTRTYSFVCRGDRLISFVKK